MISSEHSPCWDISAAKNFIEVDQLDLAEEVLGPSAPEHGNMIYLVLIEWL